MNFKTDENELWDRLRSMRTLRETMTGRDISPQEDALRDLLTYIVLDRQLAKYTEQAA